MKAQAITIKDALSFMEKAFGYREFNPGQDEIISSVLEGEDTLVIMPTGGGKSLCYQIPSFIREGITLVISPLIALMKDQVDSLRARDLPVLGIHSLMSIREQEEALDRIRSGKIKLLYASPERLRNRRFLNALEAVRVSMVAVDEAHCISQWGHDFRPDYLRISQAIHIMGRPQTIALTATATEKVRSDIVEQLKLKAPKVFITGFDRRNLYWEVLPVDNDKEKIALTKERLTGLTGAAIIYAGTRKKVEGIVESLKKDNINVEGYHAGMDKADRTRIQEDFMEGRRDLVVATNAFGMGIDRSDIRMVVHHSFPGSIEAYYQESGRAGRDGEPAKCLLLYSPYDRKLQDFFIDARYPPRRILFEIYNRLRKRPEDVLWLTYHDIGNMGEYDVSEMMVGSCIKILEDAGAVARLQRYDNRAELYFHESPSKLLGILSGKAKSREKLIRAMERLYDEDQLSGGIQFIPHELAEMAGLSPETLKRIFSHLEKKQYITYIPPFRGRGIRILRRVNPKDLKIDFQALKLRKAYELERLDQVMAYATAQGCRRAYLLDYFGDTSWNGPCGACDTCDSNLNREGISVNRTDPVLAVKILSGVARLKERFGMGMTAKVLTGSEDQMIRKFGLHKLTTYGLLSDFTQSRVREWIRELISKGCIESSRIPVGEKSYPVLAVTERGRMVMAGREEILLTAPEAPDREMRPSAKEDSPFQGNEGRIFQRLRELRTSIAGRERLPSYCIFHDRTLREMARVVPLTPHEMLGITGVGEVTMRKYGKDFLSLLQQIRQETGNHLDFRGGQID